MQFLRSLLSIERATPRMAPLDPKLRRAGIFEAIARFLHASSEARPLIVVLEDLHWMDQATGEFLAMMVESLTSGRILLCATHRTGYTLPFAQSAFRHAADAVERVARRQQRDRLRAGRRVRRCPPNCSSSSTTRPKAIRSSSRRSCDRCRSADCSNGADEKSGCVRPTGRIDVPDSVQDVLLGRLERLDAASRDVPAVAAVIGREFPRRVLERVIPDAPQAHRGPHPVAAVGRTDSQRAGRGRK